MKIVMIALLYATPTSTPMVNVADFVYDNMQECYQDAALSESILMEFAPYDNSFVDTYCVVLPSEA